LSKLAEIDAVITLGRGFCEALAVNEPGTYDPESIGESKKKEGEAT